jgi:2-keto-4-pentenoate hydratase/2-oxohepta-3-ene-1,7-dioic acid hydratase in catechol pathway
LRLATIRAGGKEWAAIVTERGLVTVESVNKRTGSSWKEELYPMICEGEVERLNDWYRGNGKKILDSMGGETVAFEDVKYAPLYRTPSKIFGIGLNYKEHADDLSEKAPDGIPGSFFKPHTSIIAMGENVELPLMANTVDGEGELAVIIGRRCKDVKREDWLDYVAGFTTACDMTSLDILEKNTRYLTIAKSFDTFFSFGPQMLTPDEIDDVMKLKVSTVLNGEIFAENVVSNMTFTPDFLVSFHSEVMTWLPGDVISTGTPRGVHIHHGDVIECRIDGFETLRNPVIDRRFLKK